MCRDISLQKRMNLEQVLNAILSGSEQSQIKRQKNYYLLEIEPSIDIDEIQRNPEFGHDLLIPEGKRERARRVDFTVLVMSNHLEVSK